MASPSKQEEFDALHTQWVTIPKSEATLREAYSALVAVVENIRLLKSAPGGSEVTFEKPFQSTGSLNISGKTYFTHQNFYGEVEIFETGGAPLKHSSAMQLAVQRLARFKLGEGSIKSKEDGYAVTVRGEVLIDVTAPVQNPYSNVVTTQLRESLTATEPLFKGDDFLEALMRKQKELVRDESADVNFESRLKYAAMELFPLTLERVYEWNGFTRVGNAEIHMEPLSRDEFEGELMETSEGLEFSLTEAVINVEELENSTLIEMKYGEVSYFTPPTRNHLTYGMSLTGTDALKKHVEESRRWYNPFPDSNFTLRVVDRGDVLKVKGENRMLIPAL